MKEIEVFEVIPSKDFKAGAKRLHKKKGFKSLPDQIKKVAGDFAKGDFEGDVIAHYDLPAPMDIYKLRLPNPDANAGKSNGYRVIYAVVTEAKIVFVLAIYYKKEQASLTETYIDGLLDGMAAEYISAETDGGK